MKTYKYQNRTKQVLILVGIGELAPGEKLVSPVPVENPNLTPLNKY